MECLYKFLFDKYGVKWTQSYLKRTIEESPYKRSMFGVSVVLTKYGLDNYCVRYNDKTDILENFNPCVIIYKNSFAVIENISDREVSLYLENCKTIKLDITEFFQVWNGVALIVKPKYLSNEINYDVNVKEEKISRFKRYTLIIGVICIIIMSIIYTPMKHTFYWWALFIINLIGIGISYLLLQKQLHIKNQISDKLCGIFTKEHSCDNVINSSYSSFFGLVKFAEIGGSFFFVNILTLLFNSKSLPFAEVIAFSVLPFTFWSIWFQKYRAKQWCALCLCTLILMWSQAIVYLFNNDFSIKILRSSAISYGIELVITYIVVCLILNSIMNFLKEFYLHKKFHSDYFVLKFDEKVINAFEDVAERFDTGIETASSILFGNPEAKTRITILSNPYCGPCARMHNLLENIPGENVCVQYIFSYFSDEKSIINKYLIAAYQQLGADRTWDIMTDWYSDGKEQNVSFFDQFGLNIETDNIATEFEKHYNWRQDRRLYGTPTVIINGLQVKYPYTVEDYMYL